MANSKIKHHWDCSRVCLAAYNAQRRRYCRESNSAWKLLLTKIIVWVEVLVFRMSLSLAIFDSNLDDRARIESFSQLSVKRVYFFFKTKARVISVWFLVRHKLIAKQMSYHINEEEANLKMCFYWLNDAWFPNRIKGISRLRLKQHTWLAYAVYTWTDDKR